MFKGIEFKKINPLIIIFFCSLLLYAVIGSYMCIKANLTILINVDFIYSTDNGYKYRSIYALSKTFNPPFHPLFQILIQPFIYIFKSFITSPRALVVFVQAFVASVSNCLFYSCLKNLKLSKSKCILFTLIFIFSYSNLIFAVLPESHIFDGMLNLLMLLYVIELTINKKREKLSKSNVFILIGFNLFSFGINTYNIIISLIFTLFVLIKTYGKNIIPILINLFKICFITVILAFVFAYVQIKIFTDDRYFLTPVLHKIKGVCDERDIEVKTFFNYPSNSRFKSMIKGTFVEPIYAIKYEVEINKYDLKRPPIMWRFSKNSKFFEYIPIFGLFLLAFIYGIKNITKIKEKHILAPLLAIILTNCVANYFWEVHFCFLFSQNTLCFLLIILAILFENAPKKLVFTSCISFFLYQIITNFIELFHLNKFVNMAYSRSNYYKVTIDIILDIIIFGIFFVFFKKIIKTDFGNIENTYKIFMPTYFIFIIMFALFYLQYRGLS